MAKLAICFLISAVVFFVVTASSEQAVDPCAGDGLVSRVVNWGVSQQIITPQQQQALLERCNEENHIVQEATRAKEEERNKPGVIGTVYHSVRAAFTFINLLYFGGALLVIGAMTLFMVVGWEAFGGFGIFFIALSYMVVATLLGRKFWEDPYEVELRGYGGEYNILGGLFYTIAVCITPLATYGFLKGSRIWPTGGSYADFHVWIASAWLPMEVSTCIVGIITVYFVRFPFLLMPVSFCLWYMSMDIVPLIFRRLSYNWQLRANVSVVFGLAMLCGAFMLDRVVTTAADFAFWPYLFGLLTFWGGLTFRSPSSETKGVAYLAIQTLLIVAGQYLDRDTLVVFGTIGSVLYYGSVLAKLKLKLIWVAVRTVLALAAFAAALRWGSTMSLLAATAGWAAANASLVLRLSGEVLLWLQLLANLGMFTYAENNAATWPVTRISFFLFELPPEYILCAVAVLGMMCFHAGTVKNELTGRDKEGHLTRSGIIYHIYRLVVSMVLVAMATGFPVLLYVGTTGILFHIVAVEYRNRYNRFWLWRYGHVRVIVQYAYGVLFVILSYIYDSKIVYLMGFGVTVHYAVLLPMYTSYSEYGWLNAALSTFMILISVAFQSHLLIVLGGLGVFFYLSYLAHRVFRNSLLFPLVLTALGLAIIFTGVHFQRYQDEVRGTLLAALPFLDVSKLNRAAAANLWTPPSWLIDSLSWPNYVMPYLVRQGTGKEVPLVCIAALLLVLLYEIRRKLFRGSFDHTPVVQISNVHIMKNLAGDGLIIKLKGTKPDQFSFRQAYLYFDYDNPIWDLIQSRFGNTALRAFKLAFYPIKMCDGMLDSSDFAKGKTAINAELHIGTGRKRSMKVATDTITSHLKDLRDNWADRPLKFEVCYSQNFGLKRGVILALELTPSKVLKAMAVKGGDKVN